MSGNDPLPTGTPIGDWGFCDHKGCTGRVPIERDSLLCDEHWEAEIRADEREKVKAEYIPVLMEHLRLEAAHQDERELGAALNAALLRDQRAAIRAKVEALRDIDPHYQPVRDAYDAVLALFDGIQ